jgi:lipopolysaccharide/colanic/teichoic acid biosynthesis glycosyltransferase
MPGILAASDACVAILKDIPMFRTTYPNKVFDYMAAGRPTILAIDGVIREVIEAANGGIFVPPGDDAALAEAVRRLANNRSEARKMGMAARVHVSKHFDRSDQSVTFLELVCRQSQKNPKAGFYTLYVKRLLDLILSFSTLILLSPLIGLLSILVVIKMARPIFFQQTRPGFHAKPFRLLKFRTMSGGRNSEGKLLPDDQRLTRFGRFMRRTSLDELPELFNVLKGDMSLVGPRPLLMRYLDRYTLEQARRHKVKPGITGWAQVNGRNAISWEQKFEHDVWYVDHMSLSLDLRIIGMTIWKILKREGISQPGHATAEEFLGTSQPHEKAPFDKPFDRLTVPSKAEGLTALSKTLSKAEGSKGKGQRR